ncbi:MAG: hypothetical protein LAT63_10875 [Marinobacter sp.]|nr:hypothetical protein [Marinobacter sp.]
MRKNASWMRVSVGGAVLALLVGCQSMTPAAQAPAGLAPIAGTLVPGERVRGELTSQSRLNVNDGSRYELFSLPLEAGAMVEVKFDGRFDGVVSVFDTEAMLLQVGSPLRFRASEAGRYTIAVSGLDARTFGPFAIRSSVIELESSAALSVPGSLQGWLYEPANMHTFTIEQAGFYQLDMTSDDFDAMLILDGPNGYRAVDDDGGEGTNSRIADRFEPGEYQLTATAFSEAEGMYHLEIAPLAMDITESRELSASSNITALMRALPDVYTLTIEEEGVYQIDMRSTNFDSYLELDGPDGFHVEDDDGGVNLDARIAEHLKPGTYILTASGLGGGTGVYTLSVQRR